MRRLFRALLLASTLMAMAALPVAAQPPTTLSYQGVLTDGGGNLVPDGNYSLTFRIYDAAVGGSVLWSESFASVAVAKGGFSVVLGNSTSINVDFALAGPTYLGISVGADPELVPRVQLTSSPSAMSVVMRGTGGAATGLLSWYPTGFGDGGGTLYLLDDVTESARHALEPDANGDGAWAWFKGAGNGAMTWDGNAGGGGGGVLGLSGPTSSMTFSTQAAGDASVALPSDAVSSGEMLDEPGISSNHLGFLSVPITSTSPLALTDVIATTITTPAAGYIVVEADAHFGIYADGAVTYQISDLPGTSRQDSYYLNAGLLGSSFFFFCPSSVRRVFYKASPGSYTFYLQGYRSSVGPGGSVHFAWNPTITAQYFPTSYGTVTAIVSADESASFEHATPVAASAHPLQPGSAAGMTVDLRELELRERRQQAQLAETRLQLMQARAKQQQEAGMKARAARSGAIGAAAPVAAPKGER